MVAFIGNTPYVPDSPIDMIDAKLLQVACPERTLEQLEPWVEPIKKSCRLYEINTIRRIGSYIANMAHESHLIEGRRENMNYSAQGLANTWPNRYAIDPKAKVKVPNVKARALSRKPQDIANDVYANRMGNGPPSSNDGWLKRGVGPGQLTGEENLARFGKTLGMTSLQAVAYAMTIEGGVMSFGWFWNDKKMNPLAESPGMEDDTQRINGGQNGLADRRNRFNNIVAEMIKRERAKRK